MFHLMNTFGVIPNLGFQTKNFICHDSSKGSIKMTRQVRMFQMNHLFMERAGLKGVQVFEINLSKVKLGILKTPGIWLMIICDDFLELLVKLDKHFWLKRKNGIGVSVVGSLPSSSLQRDASDA